MKLYAWIIGLSFLTLLSVSALASEPQMDELPCQQVAMAMASEVVAGQATKANVINTVEVEKDTSDITYMVEIVGGQGNNVQNVAATVRMFVKDGVSYCDG